MLVDGRTVRSCSTTIARTAGRAVTTLEGLGTAEKPDKVQAAFIAEQAAQCGYCTSGIRAAQVIYVTVPAGDILDEPPLNRLSARTVP